VATESSKENDIVKHLKEAGYSGLFQYGERSLADSIWLEGKNRNFLVQIVLNSELEDYVRLLATEVLYSKSTDFPRVDLQEALAYIYSQALMASGKSSKFFIAGNQWGYMYFSDKSGISDYGNMGKHLIDTGKAAIPYLVKLLNNGEMLEYEGSQEATLGNSLKYRIKDAAAYYIGKMTSIAVQFYTNFPERDAEIERLKEKLK
jgi:hypothetical protein